jgi:hypothetical protein
MDVSLDEAIGIHARALKSRSGKRSRLVARLRAHDLMAKGDAEGFRIWMQVGEQAAQLLAAQAAEEVDGDKPTATH